ncbi:lipoprotein releasing system permease protein [Candidatus Termititenax persephonae]|uniref:Lipoprotein releasing system permease protein n=1 Tax=Candidatus Termititenax persephonae TaxID=2218525 RepID=A0A388TF64_9BACT|nr:lipoprotein releasing system permease protein [Candidatus Termititenax persephonae]
MPVLKLALRNLLGAGLRSWLNIFILSVSFVIIIGCQGLYKGMGQQMERHSIDSYFGGGQYWQVNYDPFDVLTLDDAQGRVPPVLQKMIDEGKALPLLKRQATLYPRNRVLNITLNGIQLDQTVLDIPTALLRDADAAIPALIGDAMAKSTGLRQGDTVVLRWRDAHGTYDAEEIYIAAVLNTPVGEIDGGQVWIPLDRMQKMTGLPGAATLIVVARGGNPQPLGGEAGQDWVLKDLAFLLADTRGMMASQYVEGGVMYAVFLFLAMLGIFDTQILAIYRRVKEMGTLLALGTTKSDLVWIFTLEGTLHSVLAAALAFVYGTPLLLWFARVGFVLGDSYDQLGFALGKAIYPIYTPGIVAGTTVFIIALTALVSYLPCRRIAKLTPTEALRGKIT